MKPIGEKPWIIEEKCWNLFVSARRTPVRNHCIFICNRYSCIKRMNRNNGTPLNMELSIIIKTPVQTIYLAAVESIIADEACVCSTKTPLDKSLICWISTEDSEWFPGYPLFPQFWLWKTLCKRWKSAIEVFPVWDIPLREEIAIRKKGNPLDNQDRQRAWWALLPRSAEPMMKTIGFLDGGLRWYILSGLL